MDFRFVKILLRRLRLIRFDRNFFVFLIFLAISVAFWFMQTLQEDAIVGIDYKLIIKDVPRNVIFTTDIPNEVKVNIKGHGWNVLQNITRNETREIEISFDDIKTSHGTVIIDQNAFQKAIAKTLPAELHYSSTSPNRIEAFYSKGEHKRVPVTFGGTVTTRESRIQCGILFSPDTVDIYAPKHLLDTITSVSTEAELYQDLEDTLRSKIALAVPHGVKAVPDSINTVICVDLFTDKTLSVPIYGENVPASTIMRTFPQQAKVTVLVSSALYNSITPDDFLIVVDYTAINSGDNKCKLILKDYPTGVRHIRIMPEYVEYVIEQEIE